MELTAEQRAAVEHDGGRTVVLGGPATGKTTALVARYLRLVATTPASRVLVVCRDRSAVRRFVDAVLPNLSGGFDALPVTTVHGLAHELLTRSGRQVRLLTGAEQMAVVQRLLAAGDPGEWQGLAHLVDHPTFAAEVVAGLAQLEAAGPGAAEVAGERRPALARFAGRYRAALDAEGALDAPALLARAADVAPAHRDRFDHVFVDDVEALGRAGTRLLSALAGEDGAVTVAGDDGDADFPRWLLAGGPAVVRLERRFRPAPPGRLVRCRHPSMEAEAVAGELLAAHRLGVPWSDMAVLVRTLGRRARGVARALARHGIPVVPVPALARDEPMVGAVLDLLRWVEGDTAALDRLLVSPLAGLDPADARDVRKAALAGDQPLEDHPRLAPLVALRDHLRLRLRAGDTPADLAYEAWARGLSDLGTLGAVDDRALDALVALIDGLARHADDNPRATLTETLAAVEGGALVPDPWRARASAGVDGVTITSIAGAAGREWHTVVVAGCVEGELPRAARRRPLFDTADPPREPLLDERRLFALATSRATGVLIGTAAPEPGVLLSRFVEAWPEAPGQLPLAPGQPPPARETTAGAAPVSPDGRLTLSASQLDTYDDCPLRYAYQYVLRARDEAGVHAGLGSLVHRVLAAFLDPANPQPRTFESLLAVADAHWRDDVARYRPQVEEARRDFLAMLTAWWEQEGSLGDAAPEVLAVERHFEIEVGPHRLTGFIDRIDRADDGEGIRVVDYKTGKREPSPSDVADDLQLAVYHLAATRDPELAALGPPTQLQLLHVRSMRAYPQPVTEEHAEVTEQRVLATAERILAEDFEPAVDANCRTCSFHRLCPLQPEGRQVGAA